MGIFREMMGEKPPAQRVRGNELLASGAFVYNADDVIEGYRFFRRRYVAKQTALRLILAGLALASSVFMMITDGFTPMPVFCTILCIFVTAWFIKTPIDNRNKTLKSVKELSGEHYTAEVTADAIKIALADAEPDEDGIIPATLLHLDQYILDILDTKRLYVIVVAKRYVFIIPKSAFDEAANAAIRTKLTDVMETRYKTLEGK